MKAWLLGCLAAIGCVAVPAVAVDDRFNPAAYAKGGFAPATDATYRKECGACHFVYLPGLLPARSWQALLGKADHFGESLGLAPDVARQLLLYLGENAADRSDYLGARVLLERVPETSVPQRITHLPLFRTRHAAAEAAMRSGPRPGMMRSGPSFVATRPFMNCGDCHERADAGSFAQKELGVRGVATPVRPGGAL